MKSILRVSLFLLSLGLLFLISCKKELSCDNCAMNQPPISNAGADQKITLPKDSVTLDGTSSIDPDGTITSYKWAKISGPLSSNIINPDSSRTKVKTLVMGIYKFELTITDNGGLTAKDTLQVIVDDPAVNQPPIANAGPDQAITLPTDTVTLNGSKSVDPDNNITVYLWTKIAGPSSFTIANSNAVQTQVTNLVQGVYEFELKVTDAGGLVSKDTVQVIVSPAINNNCILSQTLIGSLSIKRSAVNILEAGNKIVFAGGFAGISGPPMYGASPRVDIYDRANQTWSTAELSLTRFHMGTIASGNKIFFAGGDNGQTCSRVDIYDAISSNWQTAELSEPREAVIAVAAGNKVLFAGGITGTGGSNRVDIYDQSNGTWSTFTLSKPVSGSYPGKYEISRSGVISVVNKVYFALGGHDIAVYDAQSNTWSQLISPNELSGATAVSIGSQIFFSAIVPGSIYPNLLEVYNTTNANWSFQNMIQPRSDMAAIAGDGKIFWAGGFDSTWDLNGEQAVRPVNSIEIYDVNTGLHSFHNLQQQVGWGKALKTNNKIFFSYQSYTEIYDMNNHSWITCGIVLDQALAIGNTVYQVGSECRVWKLEF